MKTPNSILLIPLFFLCFIETSAQSQPVKGKKANSEELVISRQDFNINFSQNQLQLTNLQVEELDKLIVFDMRGSVVMQQPITSSIVSFDLNNLDEGVYLLVVRPKTHGKEKMMKFVVRH